MCTTRFSNNEPPRTREVERQKWLRCESGNTPREHCAQECRYFKKLSQRKTNTYMIKNSIKSEQIANSIKMLSACKFHLQTWCILAHQHWSMPKVSCTFKESVRWKNRQQDKGKKMGSSIPVICLVGVLPLSGHLLCRRLWGLALAFHLLIAFRCTPNKTPHVEREVPTPTSKTSGL